MKDSPKFVMGPLTDNPHLAARYAPVHAMVTELLARVEPYGYAELLEGMCEEWKPEGDEIRLVEIMADAAIRLRGCAYLDAGILTQGMEACAGPGVTLNTALGRAYIRDFEGPNLLDKLSRYETRLSKEFSRSTRLLLAAAKNRKHTPTRVASTLADCKPYTSVIQ